MYEVLRQIARQGNAAFNAHQIAQATGRHPSQVQRDLDRLTGIGVLEAVETPGAAKPLKRRKTRLASAVISLPALIAAEIGEYDRAASNRDESTMSERAGETGARVGSDG